ncbi:MAG: hypothetical protein OHK0048_24110 [Rhodoferax sp.]
MSKLVVWLWCGLGAVLLTTVAQAADVRLTAAGPVEAVRALNGINIGPGPAGSDPGNATLTQAYRDRGITLIRTHDYYGPLDMATLYPDRSKSPSDLSSYNFTGPVDARFKSSDTIFGEIVNNGFEPYFRLGDSYNNVSPPSETERANWIEAVKNVLRHYRNGQWSGFNSDFRYLEIWNEPDNSTFWPNSNPYSQFLMLYSETAKALRAEFPTLKIGGSGFTHQACQTTNGKAKLAAFLDHVVSTGAPLDFFSWHIYTNTPETVNQCATYFRQQLDARGLTTTPMHLTEYNTDERNPPSTGTLSVRAQGRGAAILTSVWIRLQESGVEQALFYRGPDPTQSFPEFYGMFYADGTPKKIGLATLLWHDIAQGGDRLQLTSTSTTANELKALVTEDGNGQRRVLLANPGADPVSVDVQFADGRGLASYTLRQRLVSDAADGIEDTTLPSGQSQVSVPGFSVMLLNLSTPNNPVLDSNPGFVAQQYRDFLGREAETDGLNYWVSLLDSGSIHRAEVVKSFFDSAEFQESRAGVARLYYAYFGRIPDYSGLMYWSEQLSRGIGLDSVSEAFAQSTEFITSYGALSDAAFIERVYQNVLEHAPDTAGLSYWMSELSQGLGRGAMMTRFSESTEYRNLSMPNVQVTLLYMGMLRRAPDAAGYDYWVPILQGGGSVLPLIDGFLASPEYSARFVP